MKAYRIGALASTDSKKKVSRSKQRNNEWCVVMGDDDERNAIPRVELYQKLLVRVVNEKIAERASARVIRQRLKAELSDMDLDGIDSSV